MAETILVVDDDKSIRKMLFMRLNKLDYNMILAESGKKSLEILGSEVVDLILLDQIMPGMDGIATFEEIKKIISMPPPVIMATAHGSLDLVITFMKAGGSDFVQKPVDIDILHLKVQKAIKGERIKRELYNANIAKRVAEEANETKDIFIESVNHELRTPLTYIIGFSRNMINETSLNDKCRDNAKKIEMAGETLLEIADNISYVLPILAGGSNLQFEMVTLIDLVPVLRDKVGSKAESKGLELTFTIPETIPPVCADRKLFTKVITELIDNAIKFTEKGSVAILASVAGEIITVVVRDTGMGIPEMYVGKIYDRFYKVDTSGKKNGAGLGLFVCSKLVEIMGGDITVESNIGQGSAFSISFPRWRK